MSSRPRLWCLCLLAARCALASPLDDAVAARDLPAVLDSATALLRAGGDDFVWRAAVLATAAMAHLPQGADPIAELSGDLSPEHSATHVPALRMLLAAAQGDLGALLQAGSLQRQAAAAAARYAPDVSRLGLGDIAARLAFGAMSAALEPEMAWLEAMVEAYAGASEPVRLRLANLAADWRIGGPADNAALRRRLYTALGGAAAQRLGAAPLLPLLQVTAANADVPTANLLALLEKLHGTPAQLTACWRGAANLAGDYDGALRALAMLAGKLPTDELEQLWRQAETRLPADQAQALRLERLRQPWMADRLAAEADRLRGAAGAADLTALGDTLVAAARRDEAAPFYRQALDAARGPAQTVAAWTGLAMTRAGEAWQQLPKLLEAAREPGSRGRLIRLVAATAILAGEPGAAGPVLEALAKGGTQRDAVLAAALGAGLHVLADDPAGAARILVAAARAGQGEQVLRDLRSLAEAVPFASRGFGLPKPLVDRATSALRGLLAAHDLLGSLGALRGLLTGRQATIDDSILRWGVALLLPADERSEAVRAAIGELTAACCRQLAAATDVAPVAAALNIAATVLGSQRWLASLQSMRELLLTAVPAMARLNVPLGTIRGWIDTLSDAVKAHDPRGLLPLLRLKLGDLLP